MKNLKLAFSALILLVSIVTGCANSNSNAATEAAAPNETVKMQRDSVAAEFVTDMEDFVISLEKQSVVQTIDWETTSELWDALQQRKAALLEKLSDAQMERIQILESRYSKIENQNNKG